MNFVEMMNNKFKNYDKFRMSLVQANFISMRCSALQLSRMHWGLALW